MLPRIGKVKQRCDTQGREYKILAQNYDFFSAQQFFFL